MRKRTYKAWQKANVHLEAYLGETPCEIDEELSLFIGERVPPAYLSPNFTQGLDPIREVYGVDCYFTVMHRDGRNYYLGILPEFNDKS